MVIQVVNINIHVVVNILADVLGSQYKRTYRTHRNDRMLQLTRAHVYK